MEGVWGGSDVGRTTSWYCDTYKGDDATPKCSFLTTCLPAPLSWENDPSDSLLAATELLQPSLILLKTATSISFDKT
jgi:hypothetical protein